MFPELTINQVRAILLSMAEDESVKPLLIEKFFERFLIKKPLPIGGVNFPFIVRCSSNDYSATAKSQDAVFKNVNRCSYNPDSNKDSIGLQRCNYKKQQVFYAAAPAKTSQVSIEMTALIETTIKYVKNKNINRWYFTLSRWKLNRPLNVFILPFSKRACKRNSDFRKMNKHFTKILKKITNGNKDLYKFYREFLEFMSNIFCKRSKAKVYYKISSSFFNSILKFSEKGHNLFLSYEPIKNFYLDGIVYPSANSKAEGMNICLRKETIDENAVECDLTIMYSMLRNPGNSKNVEFIPASNESIPDTKGNICFKYIW